MAPFTSSFEIARPPDEVYAYITNPARFPEWQADVVSVRAAAGPAGVGSRFTTTRRIGRTQRTMTQEVILADAPRHWAVRGVDGPVRPDVTLAVEPLDDAARSRVTIGLDFTGRGIGRLIVPLVVRPMARRGAPHSYRALRRRLQGG